jgi:hypothetical protein
MEKFNAEDDVKASKVDAVAADGELFGANGQCDVTGDPLTRNAVPVGHQDPHGGVWRRR